MTTPEELRAQSGPSFNGQLMIRAAAEIESLQKQLEHSINKWREASELHEIAEAIVDEREELRRQNAELKMEIEECRGLLRMASVTADNLEKQNAELREALQEMIQYCPPDREEWLNDDAFYMFQMIYEKAKALAAQPEGTK